MLFLLFDFWVLLLWLVLYLCGCARGLELELAVANLCPLLVGGRRNDLRASENQGDLDGLVLHRLEGATDVNAQLTELLYALVVDEVYSVMFRTIENYTHHRLPCSHGAVGLHVHLVDADRLALRDECVEHIFAEVLALNDNLLLVCVPLWIVGRQGVDTVGFLADTRRDRPGIESEHARSSNDADLWPLWHQDGQA